MRVDVGWHVHARRHGYLIVPRPAVAPWRPFRYQPFCITTRRQLSPAESPLIAYWDYGSSITLAGYGDIHGRFRCLDSDSGVISCPVFVRRRIAVRRSGPRHGPTANAPTATNAVGWGQLTFAVSGTAVALRSMRAGSRHRLQQLRGHRDCGDAPPCGYVSSPPLCAVYRARHRHPGAVRTRHLRLWHLHPHQCRRGHSRDG